MRAALHPHPEEARSAVSKGEATAFEEWEIPREAAAGWPAAAKAAHAKWWDARIARQKEIDASIAAKADTEYLYDKPYADKNRVRVAGPFTVESLSPHRTLAAYWNDELIDTLAASGQWPVAGEEKQPATRHKPPATDFAHMILENLKAAGVQQAHKEDRITFTALTGWPGTNHQPLYTKGTDGIALWMLDTDYNEESFFVRHAYFLGANDPYKALKTTLKAEIDQEAWDSLNSDVSRSFAKPASGRIAVKVINHLGDEVMKVFGVE